MRIKKRVSLHESLQRCIRPALSGPMVDRKMYSYDAQHYMSSRQQLLKYGYRTGFAFPHKLILAITGFSIGFCLDSYISQLYYNEIKAVNNFKYIQRQQSSILLRLRLMVAKFYFYVQNNIFYLQFIKQGKSEGKLHEYTQAHLRYLQYLNYIKKRDNKFEFMDIGILEKYPYPKANNQFNL